MRNEQAIRPRDVVLLAKKSLESMSCLVLPQHEQFYPDGLSVFAGLDKVSTAIQGLSSSYCNFQGLSRP